MTLSEKALEIAITQIGQDEKPHGSNWGSPVRDYLASVGITFPAAWCMSFLYWCHNGAAKSLGVPNSMFKTGGVLFQWQKSKAKFEAKNGLKSGDIFIQDHGGGLGHTGIIEAIEGDILHTVEGNTNNSGAREGISVERKTRSIKDHKIIGYLRFT